MSFRRSSMMTELGAAFAVLAIYMLTLLAPLHQAAGLQRDLARVGYETFGGWTLCAPDAETGDENAPAVVKCAAAGIGKHDFAPLEPASIVLDARSPADAVRYAAADHRAVPALHAHVGQPRAPPVTA